MISPDRLLLQGQVYDFLRTVTIKYDPIAQYINNTLVQNGYSVNDNDPTTWKYYLNMVGQYHVSDTKMYVVSLDTKETILFSPSIFVAHPRTKTAYSPGGSYYNRLCETYPEQVDLIKSILFPVTDIAKAITAPDLTLLGYGSGYLEDYEESVLIGQIENFLIVYKERWYFDFLDDEPYFYLTIISSLPIYLAMLIMSSRMANINTPYVHSWDVWNELEANGLDNYSDILDREKSIMLYQNIDYFKANAGKQSNLEILTDRLLSSFGIGLYGRIVVQEAQSAADTYQLTPQLVPVRLPRSTDATTADIEIKTVSTMMAEIYEKGLTPSDAAETVSAVERQLGDTTLNNFATKFLEIRPIAKDKPYAELLNMFLLETLVVSIKEGYYAQPVEIIDPLTKNPIYLLPSELLALYNYAIQRSLGLKINTFPQVARLYRSFTTTIGTPKSVVPYSSGSLYLSSQVNVADYLSNLSYAQNLQSPAEFTTNVTALWLRFLGHYIADQNTLLEKRHAAYVYLDSLCHKRREEPLNLVPNHTTYDDWLGAGGIDIYSTILTQYEIQPDASAQWANLADTIITVLIPTNDVLSSFGNFTLSDSGYARLRQLFIQLCSYRVVFLESQRDTSEFAIGAKWSSDYGPDHMQTYADMITVINTDTADHIVFAAEVPLHTGFTLERTTIVDEHVSYTVRSTTTTVGTTMQQTRPMVQTMPIKSSNVMTHGTLNLEYVGTLTQMANP